jgi:membrane-associated phospholipid phosphatase
MKTGLALFLLPLLTFGQVQPSKKFLEKRYVVPVAVVAAVATGLLALDPVSGKYFRQTASFNQFNRVFSGNITMYGTLAAPAALAAAGFIGHDSKMKKTALEAGVAIVDAELLTTVLKDVTRRVSPSSIAPGGDFSGTFGLNNGSNLRGNGSMPSGHAMSAFAVATVVSRRYGNHRWVPYAAYGLAGAVAFSRVSDSAHFGSDVFIGGVLGYSVGRFSLFR